MPELPEVETVRRLLDSKLRGKKFVEARIFFNKIIKEPGVSEFRKKIIGQKLQRVDKKAKYLIFVLEDYVLISHLRMEGKYFITNKNDPGDWKHILVSFTFSDGTELRYHDTRRFGTMHLLGIDNYQSIYPLSSVGLEPFSSEVTSDYLIKNWRNKKIAIKSTILEQNIIAGIGNIYANEILFSSRIHPDRPANSLTINEVNKLIENSRKILGHAIELGGTTISTYHPEPGVDGEFSKLLKVHGRVNCKCVECGTKIVKYKLNGRGTYMCPHCQN